MRVLRILATLGLFSAMIWPATAGEPTYMCLGQVATHVGTSGPDNIDPDVVGSVIVGLGGDDTLDGSVVCGGKGADELDAPNASGGSDDDFIEGHNGGGSVLGGGGDDRLWDLSGDGVVYKGNAGNDVYTDNYGDDAFYGGAGNDRTSHDEGGGGGADRYYGGDGDDMLRTTAYFDEPDFVNGGAGNDTCFVDSNDTVVNCETVNGVAT